MSVANVNSILFFIMSFYVRMGMDVRFHPTLGIGLPLTLAGAFHFCPVPDLIVCAEIFVFSPFDEPLQLLDPITVAPSELDGMQQSELP